MKKRNGSLSQTRLLIQGVGAGFGIAQALTSWMRGVYYGRYKKPNKRVPRVIFVFDALLAATMLALAVFVSVVYLKPLPAPSLQATFSSPSISSGDAFPIAVRIRATESGGSHASVRVRWDLPSGVETLESNPPLESDGSIFLGSLAPGQEVVSRLIVRVLRPVGESLSFGFRIDDLSAPWGFRTYVATESRDVESAGIITDIPEEFLTDAVASKDAVLPIRIRNTSHQDFSFVEVRPISGVGLDFPRQVIGDLPANSERFIFLPLGDLEFAPTVSWSVFVSSRVVVSGSWSAQIQGWNGGIISEPLVLERGATSTSVSVQGKDGEFLSIVHPFSSVSVSSHELYENENQIFLSADSNISDSRQRWLASIVDVKEDGVRVLGPGAIGISAASVPFSSVLRYTSAEGDQIGAGPNPPRVGEETRYWVFWVVGPTDASLKNILVTQKFPVNVEPTGNVASPDGGTWSASNRTMTWRLPEFSAGEAVQAMFGFEIAVTPSSSDGMLMDIVGEVLFEAKDVETGRKISTRVIETSVKVE